MKKSSCLISILVVCLVEFQNNHYTDARKHHHQPSIYRRIHASYQPWQSDGNGDGGGGSLSPWELNLITEILTEFGIAECPAIDSSGFIQFREYLSEPIARARESRIINDRFTQVYDSLTYCLGSESSGIEWQDGSESEESDGNTDKESVEGYQETSEDGEDPVMDASTTTKESAELFNDNSPQLTVVKESDESTSQPSDDKLESLDIKKRALDEATSDEGFSTEPSDLDDPESVKTDSEEIGLLRRAIELGQQIIKKVEDLFVWIGPERRGAKQFVDQLGANPPSSSAEETDSEEEPNPSYHFERVPERLLEPILNSTKGHFSDIFERLTVLVYKKCPALQKYKSFIEDAVFKILTLVYEDLERAAESDEVVNVDKELQSKLRDCTNPDK